MCGCEAKPAGGTMAKALAGVGAATAGISVTAVRSSTASRGSHTRAGLYSHRVPSAAASAVLRL